MRKTGAAASAVVPPPSFDEFYTAESETLYRRMRLVTRNHHEAEEVVQDAFLSLYERWDRMAGVPDPVGYLYRTAFNAWKKRTRRAARVIRHVFAPTPARDDFEAADARTVVGEALGHLTPRQRAAIVLTDLSGSHRRTRRDPRHPTGDGSGARVAGPSGDARTPGRHA